MKCVLLHGLGQSAASWGETVKGMGQTADALCPELSDWLPRGAAYYIDLCGSMVDLDFQASLKQIHCPVLVVCGEKDRANKAASIQMKGQIPNAELLMISGAGHEVKRDAPDELGRAINFFLSGISG